MRLSLETGQGTHPGRVRETNEDSLCVLLPPALTNELDALIVVADGIGGHNAGEVASQYVTDKFQELFASTAYRGWVPFAPGREDYNVLVLKEVIERLNSDLYQQATQREEYRGMGTTATVALIVGTQLFLGHVGDSRAYLLSKGELRQLTTDHSWVMEQVEQGLMTSDQAAADPRKNQITRALGVGRMLKVERKIVDLQPGDALMLCTDGLTNMVGDTELKHYLQMIPEPNAVSQKLIEVANQNGGGDNITVVVVRAGNGVVAPPLVAPVETEQTTDRIILGSKKDAQSKRGGGQLQARVPAVSAPQPTPVASPMQPVTARILEMPTSMAQSAKLEECEVAAPSEHLKVQTNSRLSSVAIGFVVIVIGLVVFAALVNVVLVYTYLGYVLNKDDWILAPIVGVVTLGLVLAGILITAWFLRFNKSK